MMTLAVSQGALWVAVILLCVVCTALARQIGVLHERIAPMGAMSLNGQLTRGARAPVLSLQSLSGASVTIGSSTAARSLLVFFLAPTCPVCKSLLPVLNSIQRHEKNWLDMVLASDGGEWEAHRDFVSQHQLQGFPYVVSEALGRAYGVSRLPYAVLIDEQGGVTAFGLVNSREQLESLFEAKRLNVGTLQDLMHESAR
jgi:methylamine dehydrogenase accessory protein MauD